MINRDDWEFKCGNAVDVLRSMPDKSVQMCVTSPPYYNLRDYGTARWEGGDPNCPHYRTSKFSENTCTGHKAMGEQGQPVGDAIYKTVCPLCGAVRVDEQIGLEETPEEYIDSLVKVFREVKRVLKDDGTLWVNIGDTYNGAKHGNTEYIKRPALSESSDFNKKVWQGAKTKDLIGIPWMLAFALRADGWYLRQDIIWHKLNPMPESVKDRCTKSHEYIFLLSKSPNYLFNYEDIQEVATGYDGRKDIVLKGSPKYDGELIMPGNSEQSLAKGGHDRWKFKNLQYDGQTPNTMHELMAQGLPDKMYTKRVPTNIAFGGTKYGESDDSHYQTYSGKAWEQKVVSDGTIEVPIRNKRDVWDITVAGYAGAHFATYPEELVSPCILAGSNKGDTVLDPFNGAGTTGIVAIKNGRKYIGIDLNPEYIELAKQRFEETFFRAQKISEPIVEDGMRKIDLLEG